MVSSVGSPAIAESSLNIAQIQEESSRESWHDQKTDAISIARQSKRIDTDRRILNQTSTLSLQELHEGDAFSFDQFLVKTNSFQNLNSSRSNLPGRKSSPDQANLEYEALDPLDILTAANDSAPVLSKTHYFYSQTTFISVLNAISHRLIRVPKDARQGYFKAELSLLNHNLPAKVCLPLWCPASKSRAHHHVICRIVVSEGVVLNSAEKVPFLLLVEVVTGAEDISHVLEISRGRNPIDLSDVDFSIYKKLNNRSSSLTRLSDIDDRARSKTFLPTGPESGEDDFSTRMKSAAIMLAQLNTPNQSINKLEKDKIRENILREMTSLEEQRLQSASVADENLQQGIVKISNPTVVETQVSNSDPSASIFREDWKTKEARIGSTSPYRYLDGWQLLSVIVKTGSDLRQEHMACQLIKEMKNIWELEKVDVWVKYYRVLVTSEDSGLIETVQNSVSLHSIKKEASSSINKDRSNYFSLRTHYLSLYGNQDSKTFSIAQENFIKSLAAYSVITYILSIKDRHNGNILFDSEGHIIHIDFGFMFNNAPGSFKFESAPFKLTQEYLDVIGGLDSKCFRIWRTLVIQALMAARKHADKIILLVELMQKDSKMPCFTGVTGPEVIQSLRERFLLGFTEKQVEEYVDKLIIGSLNNVFTRLYDVFQFYSNGILY